MYYGMGVHKQKRTDTTHIPHPPARRERTLTLFIYTIRCTTALSAHASYKGYGCNNPKPPWHTHRNTIIDVVVLGCGLIRTGEGAAAPFIGVHILGEIWPAGGFDSLAESRWED